MAVTVDTARNLDTEEECADGWSREDFLFGRGEDCDVNTIARDVGALLACVFATSSASCLAYHLWRKRSKGQAHTDQHQSLALALGTQLYAVAWTATNLLLPVPAPYISIGIHTEASIRRH